MEPPRVRLETRPVEPFVLCPFRVKYPHAYEVSTCGGFSSWKSLREHLLERRHKPRDQCPRCGQVFLDDIELGEHFSVCQAVPTKVLESPIHVQREMVSPIRNLQRRGHRARPIEDLYSDLWTILFGNDTHVPDRTVWLRQYQSKEAQGIGNSPQPEDTRTGNTWTNTAAAIANNATEFADIIHPSANNSSYDLATSDRDQSHSQPEDTHTGNPWTDTVATTVSNAIDFADIIHPSTNDSSNGSVTSDTDQSHSQPATVFSNNLVPEPQDADLVRGATEYATTVSGVTKVDNFDQSITDNSDNVSVASSVDQFYHSFSNVLVNNLAQDLQGVNLTNSRDMLAARLKEFSLRLGNEDASENHLRMMSIAYRRARYGNYWKLLFHLSSCKVSCCKAAQILTFFI